ncbi:hypothetical protein D9619_000196 [Psilocybe cf. subviscida]|uniref:NACHT domain-containing protein n=1 Tax=Psilocybe cf. subviscida TaxID=2480587 RepID=A0A8H5F2B8_9AGAR|nr:hypothetical protein D9619_000196 [Psilocybe cf. subviscida]
MFSGARNVVITGNSTLIGHVIDRTAVPAEESLAELEQGTEILLMHVARGAMHNSGERFDAPTCHPQTRMALQDDVVGWVDEPPGGQLVTWMYGPAGAGKSAIAQTISQKLDAKGQLTASFFFSRTSSSEGRGDESALIATLAYQLSLSAPATKPFIARAVYRNKLIFDLSLDAQVQALITHPLTATHQDDAGPQWPKVIVVDGLDECRKDDSAQSRVIRALIMGLRSIPRQNQKLFITSRPEHHIAAIFRDYEPDLLRKMELNNDWNPDDDIRTFLNTGFADIRRSHPYFEGHPADQTWPNRADIDTLVARSSGQFIYASVVIKYIKSEDYYDPATRLEVILNLENNEDRPYTELDALYEHIFLQVRAVEKVLTVLSLERMHTEEYFGAPLGFILSDFIGARIPEIQFWHRPLISLLTWERDATSGMDAIRYMHASLPDFLANESRSNTFYIYSIPIATKMVQRALDLLENKDTWEKHDLMPVLLTIPWYYAEKFTPQHKIRIYSMLSDFNFVENVLSRMYTGILSHKTTRLIVSYLNWILTESESDNWQTLVKPLSQIQTWIIDRLAYRSFNGLDNTDQIDLWPFFTSSIQDEGSSEGLRRQISAHIEAALEICGPTTSPYQVTRDKDVELSDQAVLFRYLIPAIPRGRSSRVQNEIEAVVADHSVSAQMNVGIGSVKAPISETEEVVYVIIDPFLNWHSSRWLILMTDELTTTGESKIRVSMLSKRKVAYYHDPDVGTYTHGLMDWAIS